ncbi:hypothetical protein ACFYUV_20595 [Nonomuraea sp. NPDC003560]|uniref:hypothetical protein n=1 Tax=Nonomuraea sp. NPDC003560 TaxID=3364341 RepID=UPI003683435A
MIIMRIVSVRTGAEVSRAEIADDGTITYSGGESAQAAVRNRMRERGIDEAAAVSELARDGWSNGYLKVPLPPHI